MRLSRYFLPILRETPKEAEIVSHRLALRAGLIRQESAGIYAWLPFGLRVLNKICAIIREEQNRSGAIELLMPTIQSADLWRESGRYDAYGKEMLRITDRSEREMLFGPTNEEMITEIFRGYVRSYKSLPLNLYHLQWKFRDEVRPRFGTMRSREFLMKDAYSFDIDMAAARHAYNRMFVAYLRTFDRMGLKSIPMRADTGPIGGDLSHEFIILASTGESQVFCHKNVLGLPVPAADTDFGSVPTLQSIVAQWTSLYAATEDMHDAAAFAGVPEPDRVSARGIEVGHIFYFGTKYSEPMKAVVAGPDAVAPFDVAILNLKPGDSATDRVAGEFELALGTRGLSALIDDTDERPGGKFASADLIGLPWQVIVGPKGLADGKVELKRRATGERMTLTPADAVERILA